MKEYKSITIKIDFKNRLDDQLNEFAKEGWYIIETLNKFITTNELGQCWFLLEREVKIWKAAFGSVGVEDRFIDYLAATKEEVQELIEKETRIESDESFKYFSEIK